MPMHIKLAAAAKADIAVKALRARKAGMYPGSPARRALAEDPNLAVRCAPMTRHSHSPAPDILQSGAGCILAASHETRRTSEVPRRLLSAIRFCKRRASAAVNMLLLREAFIQA